MVKSFIGKRRSGETAGVVSGQTLFATHAPDLFWAVTVISRNVYFRLSRARVDRKPLINALREHRA